jgi:hypothetical protein
LNKVWAGTYLMARSNQVVDSIGRRDESTAGGSPPVARTEVGESHQFVEHAVQMSRRDLDVGVLSLPRAHFRGDDSAPVHILEVTVGKLVPGLGLLGQRRSRTRLCAN